MFGKKNEKLETIKDLVGSRAAYIETVKMLELDGEEKEIFLRASIEVKKKKPDQEIIDKAYVILLAKSYQGEEDTNGEQNLEDTENKPIKTDNGIALNIVKEAIGTSPLFMEFVNKYDFSTNERSILSGAFSSLKKEPYDMNRIYSAYEVINKYRKNNVTITTDTYDLKDDTKEAKIEESMHTQEFCTNCGNKLEDNVRFCSSCGASTDEKKDNIHKLKEVAHNTERVGVSIFKKSKQIISTPIKKKLYISRKNIAIIIIAIIVISAIFIQRKYFYNPGIINPTYLTYKKGIAYFKSNLIPYTGKALGRRWGMVNYLDGKKHGISIMYDVKTEAAEDGTVPESKIIRQTHYLHGKKDGKEISYLKPSNTDGMKAFILGATFNGNKGDIIMLDKKMEKTDLISKVHRIKVSGIYRDGKKYDGTFITMRETLPSGNNLLARASRNAGYRNIRLYPTYVKNGVIIKSKYIKSRHLVYCSTEYDYCMAIRNVYHELP